MTKYKSFQYKRKKKKEKHATIDYPNIKKEDTKQKNKKCVKQK